MKNTTNNKHAVVIGGSMAGLMAARVLSEHFAQVTVLERDALHNEPESRKGQPHTRHLHGLLARGLELMAHYFPDLIEALQENGALVADMGAGMRWYAYGGYRLQIEAGMQGALMSRPLLEWQIRSRVQALANVQMLDECDVEELLFSADRQCVAGVQVTLRGKTCEQRKIEADLVVDASGRGSASPKWLQAAGYGRPAESEVKINMGYATRLYRRRPGDLNGAALIMVTPEGPDDKRSGMVFPIEGDRWIVTLGGINGDNPPLDEQGFLAFARSLPAPDVYDIITKAEPLSAITPYKFPSSLRRHYEKMVSFPDGYLVLGDAICSFNPIYGQGMTCAAMEAEALDNLLTRRHGNLHRLAQEFFARVAKIVDNPWQMAVGADFRFRGTEGKKAASVNFVNAYVAKVHRATHHDPVVQDAFLKVMNLIRPPASLFQPNILVRVIRGTRIRSQGRHLETAKAER